MFLDNPQTYKITGQYISINLTCYFICLDTGFQDWSCFHDIYYYFMVLNYQSNYLNG